MLIYWLAINNEAINRLLQIPIETSLDETLSLDEIRKGIHQLSSGKAPGADCIPAEVYKEGGEALTKKLHDLFAKI